MFYISLFILFFAVYATRLIVRNRTRDRNLNNRLPCRMRLIRRDVAREVPYDSFAKCPSLVQLVGSLCHERAASASKLQLASPKDHLLAILDLEDAMPISGRRLGSPPDAGKDPQDKAPDVLPCQHARARSNCAHAVLLMISSAGYQR
jgi:hypothetical protein